MIENKTEKYNLKKRISFFIGVTLILMGIGLILLGDTFTYAPYIFMLFGIFVIIITKYNVKPTQLLVVSIFIMYFITSFYYEAIIKSYDFKITVPQNQNKFYFIASNYYLKWGDYLLTWFKPKTININLVDDKVLYLNRGMPNSIFYDRVPIAKQGYIISNEVRGDYEFIVLLPFKNRKQDFSYQEVRKLTDSIYNMILNKKLMEYKLDSIEKNGFN